MDVIYKYPLKEERTEILLPEGSIPLTAQVQLGIPVVWVRQSRELPDNMTHRFIIVGTGQAEVGPEWEYLSTIQLNGGALIYHVFHMIYLG